MVGWFRLRRRLRELAEAKARADDEIRALRAANQELTERLTRALEDALRSREMVADWIAQRTFGFSVYREDTPKLPEIDPKAMPHPRVQARILVQQAELAQTEES